MAFIYSLADTWNDAGTTFTGIGLNVTDTASATASRLMDLQVGGSSKLNVSKGGEIFLPQSGGDGAGLIAGGSAFANARAYIGQYGLRLSNNNTFQWSGSTNLQALDLTLARDAANTLAQRNSTNAQTFNLYNTYTDASNYERGFMKWNSNVLQIGAEAAGTGTVRPIQFITNSYIAKTAGGANYAVEAGSYVRYASGVDLLWSNNVNAITGITTDVGIKRAAAGQLQITDGSTGTGELIFIVPTTDPGITGALWNNAGTLSISA